MNGMSLLKIYYGLFNMDTSYHVQYSLLIVSIKILMFFGIMVVDRELNGFPNGFQLVG